ncbi:MAG: hypothetical protein U5J63_05025 [Fodinibius sp.]|nr:hypothetical protein [Fodinibius sp.]
MNVKIFGFFSVFLIIGGLLTVNYMPRFATETVTTSTEPCQQPLTYRIGDIDSRFNISQQELKAIMKEVESLWATALDRQLLEYNTDGKVAIHLVYSDEQKRTEEEQAFSERLQAKEDRIEVIREEYEDLKKNFEQLEQGYRQTLSRFNEQASNL